jgi:hypothetical protein
MPDRMNAREQKKAAKADRKERMKAQEAMGRERAEMHPDDNPQPTLSSYSVGETKPRGRRKISEVGSTSDGSLSCPKCGGQQFTAKRSKKAKALGGLAVGVGALAAPKTQVKCVTCGAMYKRG